MTALHDGKRLLIEVSTWWKHLRCGGATTFLSGEARRSMSLLPRQTDHLFLYIDIVGFSELVPDKGKVQELYQIIDDLNVFSHEPTFK
jgi:hypothetical protein